jgi:hypothetical protein
MPPEQGDIDILRVLPSIVTGLYRKHPPTSVSLLRQGGRQAHIRSAAPIVDIPREGHVLLSDAFEGRRSRHGS